MIQLSFWNVYYRSRFKPMVVLIISVSVVPKRRVVPTTFVVKIPKALKRSESMFFIKLEK